MDLLRQQYFQFIVKGIGKIKTLLFSLSNIIAALALIATIVSALNLIYGNKGKKRRAWISIGIGIAILVCTLINNTRQSSTVFNYKNELKGLRQAIFDSLGIGNVVPNISFNSSEDINCIYSVNRDSIKVDFQLNNVSTADAYGVKVVLHTLGVVSHRYYNLGEFLQDSGLMIPARRAFAYHDKINAKELPILDSMYLYLDVSYTNFNSSAKRYYKEMAVWIFKENKYMIPDIRIKERIKNYMGIK